MFLWGGGRKVDPLALNKKLEVKFVCVFFARDYAYSSGFGSFGKG